MSIFKEIKYFIQRGKRGYSNRDLWSMHCYLSEIIPPMVRHLEKNNMGCPHELWDGKKVNDECHKWREILEEIAQGFEAAEQISEKTTLRMFKEEDGTYNEKIDKEKDKQLSEKFERGMYLLKEYFFALWD